MVYKVDKVVDCVCILSGRFCTHQAAPRRLFGPALCIEVFPSADPRVSGDCQLKVSHYRPPAPPPPGEVVGFTPINAE